MSDEYLTADEAALIIKRKAATLRQYARAGVIPARKIGKGWLFLKSDLICSTNALSAPARIGGSGSRSRASRSDNRVAQIARNLRKRLNNN